MIDIQKLAALLGRVLGHADAEMRARPDDTQTLLLYLVALANVKFSTQVYVLQRQNTPAVAAQLKRLVGALAEVTTAYTRQQRTEVARRVSDLVRSAYTEVGGHYDEPVHGDGTGDAREAEAARPEAEVYV